MMRKIRQILISLGILLFLISLFSLITSAQQIPPSYGFLEVVDYKNKPVADAEVSSANASGEIKTNQNGQIENGLMVYPHHYGDTNFWGRKDGHFSIKKDGYYSFNDYFGLFGFLAYTGDNKGKPIKIELLKIPETRAEKKAIGKEQIKRELFGAVIKSDADTVRKFLKSGLDPNLKTSDLRGVPVANDLPLIHYAARLGNVEIIKELLDSGAELRRKDTATRNILLTYFRTNRYLNSYNKTEDEKAAIDRRFEEGFDILVKAGADIDFADEKGNTPLFIAVRQNYTEIIKKLLALHLSDEVKNKSLLESLSNGDRDAESLATAELLLKSGIDPNFIIKRDDDFDRKRHISPLIQAAEYGVINSIRLLLNNKANINLTHKNGKTPLLAALDAGQQEAAQLLLDAGANGKGLSKKSNRTALMVAAEKDYVEIIKTLLTKGFSLKDRDEWQETALEIAINGKTSKEMIEFLLKAGADPNGQTTPYCKIPITYSAALSRPDVLRLLIIYQADVNLKCDNYHSAIVRAAESGEAEAVKILLEAGANITGEIGQKALKYATENLKSEYPSARSRAAEVIKILEAAGAK